MTTANQPHNPLFGQSTVSIGGDVFVCLRASQADVLKQARIDRALTQQQIADIMGLPVWITRNVERCKSAKERHAQTYIDLVTSWGYEVPNE